VPEDTTYISCSKLPTIVIYPNPTSDILKINIGNTGVTNITLFSLLGEKIQEIETKNTYFEIIMTKYSKGIYFLHFKTTQGVFIKKIMKI
ncbi:MAG: T9SS type A sorting domain-containing protein, partial [Bacteroidales bacterium]